MIEEIDNVPEIRNNPADTGDESSSGKSPFSYEPPKEKESLLPR